MQTDVKMLNAHNCYDFDFYISIILQSVNMRYDK